MRHTKQISMRFEQGLLLALWRFLLESNLERMAYLFCHAAETENEIIVFPKRIIVPDERGEDQKRRRAIVEMDVDVTNEIYRRFGDSDYSIVINCHSHPFDHGDVCFSGVDDAYDKTETHYIMEHMPEIKRTFGRDTRVRFMSLLFGQKTFAVRYYNSCNDEFADISSVTVIGDPVLKSFFRENDTSDYHAEMYQRQVMAFGTKAQNALKDLTVAIVGIGGIGSIVAEGLSRVGCRKIILIDNDEISVSNLNRWQSGTPDDVGHMKVEACETHIVRMFPDATVITLPTDIYSDTAVSLLKESDCIIGCLDNAPARYFLNRIALQYLVPYIDGGVVIETDESNVIQHIRCRMAVVIPSVTACMDCSKIAYYDQKEVNDFFLDAQTRARVQEAGYIKDRDEEPAPSVYPLNLSVASIMLLEFMNVFSGFKPVNHNIHIDWMTPEDGMSAVNNRDHHEGPDETCVNCAVYRGVGDSESLNRFTDRNRIIHIPGLE